MDYTHLSEKQATGLRHQRIQELEAEHYRTRLVLEEKPGDAQAAVDLAEIWRRIQLHRDRLGIVVPPLDGVQARALGEPDTPGSGDEAPAAAKRADAGPMTTTADYQDGPHEDSGTAPEGLETKSVDPEYASTTAHHTDGAEHDAESAGGADEVAGGAEDGRTDQDSGEAASPHSV